MSLKNKLEALNNAWTQLAEVVKKKFQVLQSKCDESNRKLETALKESQRLAELLNKSEQENSENEKVLEQLLKEFKELAGELG